MKKLITIGLLAVTTNLYANLPHDFAPRGISIVTKDEFFKHPMFKDKTEEDKKIKEKGNISKDYIDHLFNFGKHKKTTLVKNDEEELKHSFANIPLSFSYTPIKDPDILEVKGFSPAGSFNNDAWDGIGEIFIHKDFGMCTYVVTINSAVTLVDATVNYDVNHKPTSFSHNGDDTTGFVTGIYWYSELKDKRVVSHELECVNKKRGVNLDDKLILFARSIDNQNNYIG